MVRKGGMEETGWQMRNKDRKETNSLRGEVLTAVRLFLKGKARRRVVTDMWKNRGSFETSVSVPHYDEVLHQVMVEPSR